MRIERQRIVRCLFADFHFDLFRLGLFRLGQAQGQHAIVQIGRNVFDINLFGDFELAEEIHEFKFPVDQVSRRFVLSGRLEREDSIFHAHGN